MNDNTKLAKPVRRLTGLLRPKFSPGLLLQDDDLTEIVNYTRNLNRLMFRTMFGCGVLCGLEVTAPPKDDCGKLLISVAKGVALNCAGDPIEVSASQLEIDTCGKKPPCFLWVAVRHIEGCCVPRTAQCSPDDDATSACTREYDGFELCVFAERPPCSCGCHKLGDPPATTSRETQTNDTRIGKVEQKATPATAKPVKATNSWTSDTVESDACVDPEQPETRLSAADDACLCNLRTGKGACYESHYNADCPCDCCDCDWVILAVASRLDADGNGWAIDHSVRRFVRPVLMRDPLVK
ncbi:hypothetical protein [Paraburkholderia graminis]|uniref:hypothetical protein n=1 Tax=Paraburkholderia graminis TaxID=60548 RepID=UPI0038BD5059